MHRLKTLASLALLALLAAGLVSAQDAAPSGTPEDICAATTPAEEPETRRFDGPQQVIEPGIDYRAILCTDAGPIYIDLFEQHAPITVNNFVFLAQQGYYNNTTFHRVIEGFMAQGGDPTGSGSGNPGYQFPDEIRGFLVFDRPGLLAMANAGPGTNGSQFFITLDDTSWLDYNHTIFGQVLAGFDNVNELRLRDPLEQPDYLGSALETVVIIEDPSLVDAETTTPEVVDRAEVEAAMSVMTDPGQLPPDLSPLESSGTTETGDVVLSAPASVQDDFADYLASYGHQYRAEVGISNADCNIDYFFTTLGYTVDVFESAEAAAAALEDEFLVSLNVADGYEHVESDGRFPVLFARSTQDCSGASSQEVKAYILRGRYLAALEVLAPDRILEQVSAEILLSEFVGQIFERPMSGVYASELSR